MHAQNSREINRGYLKFSGYLVACVVIATLAFFCYYQTANVEVNRIVEKTEEYDKIYVKQMDLANRIDSLYYYTTLFNTNLNDAYLLHSVSRRKQEILSMMESMSSRDIRLYQRLMSQVNDFLSVKDSIRQIRSAEDLLKSDLLKCTEDNKQAARQLTIGGMTLTK